MRSRPVGQVSRSQSHRQPSGRRLVTRCGFDRNLRERGRNGASRNRLEYRSMRSGGAGRGRRQGRHGPRPRQDCAGGDARSGDDAAVEGVGGRHCRRTLRSRPIARCCSSRPRPNDPGRIRFRYTDDPNPPPLVTDSDFRFVPTELGGDSRKLSATKSRFREIRFRDRIFDTALGLEFPTPGIPPHTAIKRLIRKMPRTLSMGFARKSMSGHDGNLVMIHTSVTVLSIMP